MARIWLDLDNAPHVITLSPIVEELRARRHEVLLTARDVNQTPEIAAEYGLNPMTLGHPYGRSRSAKIVGTLWHGVRLARVVRKFQPDLAVSHGSRAQAVAALLLGVPSAVLFDYEKADLRVFRVASSWHFYPEVLDHVVATHLGIPKRLRRPYPGLKEHLALLTTRRLPSDKLRSAGIPEGRRYAVLRPESDVAHYLPDGPSDDSLVVAAVELCRRLGLYCLVAPRTPGQYQRLERQFRNYSDVGFLRHPINGMALLRGASLLLSGGGTMNREAAVLGVPCVSIFRGDLGTIDRMLIRERKMIHVINPETLQRISGEELRCAGGGSMSDDIGQGIKVRDFIVRELESLVEDHGKAGGGRGDAGKRG